MSKLLTMKISAFFALSVGLSGVALASPQNVNARGVTNSSQPTQTLPSALQPVLYQALAKDAGQAYRIGKNGCATLSNKKFKACFNGSGAHFSGEGQSLALHLVAYGRGEILSPVKAVRPTIKDNRASYVHGDLAEWWRVLPIGFEQGFTITKRPVGNGELVFALSTSRPDAGAPDGALGWGKLRYGKLVVTDAKGKVVPATLKSEGDRILIAVNDAHAAYPLTVDPLVWLEQKVAANDGAGYDNFGYSVAVSGTTALIGADHASVNGNAQGTVYVFTESNGTWAQTAKLAASDGASGDEFGYSVAISGATVLIGAKSVTVNGNLAQGAAYIFTESDGTWTQTAKLIANDGALLDQFGNSVAVSGTTALVGSASAGAVYAFTNSGGTWVQSAKLTPNDDAGSNMFGESVVFDGAIALIGAPEANDKGSENGAAYMFSNSGGTWTQTAKLTASDGASGDHFGSSVDLSGTAAIIGARYAAVNGDETGAAYVFSDSGGGWVQTAKLTASDGMADDGFGRTVALSGTTALVGAYAATVNGNNNQGAAYLFTKSNGVWTQARKFTASDGATYDDFGLAVALSGTTALISAPYATVNGDVQRGAAYFYGKSDLGLALSVPDTVGEGQTYVSQTIATNNASAASPAVSATITVPAAASFVSAAASQGSCNEDSGVVTCDFGSIEDNAGTATANVTLKATGNVGDTIDNTAGIAKATPALSASAPTTITEGGACPNGYTEYDGTLNPGEVARSPVYQAPSGEENAILAAPAGFELYAVYQSGRYGRHVYRVPGNEVHRWGPKGRYMWLVRAHDGAGSYTLCLQHP